MQPTVSMCSGSNLPVIGTISKSDLYSTTEKVVGMWIDGRPLYQKVVSFTMNSSATALTDYTTNHGISNLREVVNTNITWNYNTGQSDSEASSGLWLRGNNYSFDDCIYNVDIRKSTIVIQFRKPQAWNGITFYLFLRYTKTTDAANSYNYANENDYSTNEKIVGTWIDGSNLYQRTITGTFPTFTSGTVTVVDIETLATNIKVVNMFGFAHKDGSQKRNLDTFDPQSKNGATLFVNGSQNMIRFRCDFNMFSEHIYYITIQYIKT